jgi:murein DD-endopeptidase MepM/ murein hydrolase activator NlpD
MPEVRTDSGICRCWRLRALVTAITLLGGAAVARSSVCQVRRVRARRREIARRRQEPAAVATARIVPLRTSPLDVRRVPALWPVRGAITSPFGWRRSPFGGEQEWHSGIDIRARYGTPVRATADGEVVFAGRARGYGVLVVLDHGAATTRYAHLATSWVHAGQSVLRGEPVGAVGGTGRATAAHLHYEVRLGSEAVDPGCFLGDGDTTPRMVADRRSAPCGVVRARLEGQRATSRADVPS